MIEQRTRQAMSFFSWLDTRIQHLRWFDIALVKLSTAAFVLLCAKYWTPLLSLEWYWYLAIAVIASLRPFYIFMLKK